MSDNRPYLAIPIGDPAGIGPEIVIKSVTDPEIVKTTKCVIIGDKKVLTHAFGFMNAEYEINCIEEPSEGNYEEGIINIINIDNIDLEKFQVGEVIGMCGKAAYDYIEKSIELAMNNKVAAVVTTPINKEALKAGNVNFIGHTEIFGELTGTAAPLTMFEVKNLRVFFLSRHISLRKACDMVTKERLVSYVKRCMNALKGLGITTGTMAIAGLNPHSGEHGLFGTEEVTDVFPAIDELKKEGYAIEGPIGADSVFHQALHGKYNSVLSLYHDQGHIATKTLDFERTISLTLGMPILRTSVDHGTALDIAGKGIASAVSMMEAIRLGAKYSKQWQGNS